jgi:hypothetical protein
MAIDATWLNDAVEAVVQVLIAGRKIPARGPRVVRKRCLEEIIVTAQKRAKTVFASADDPADFVRASEDFLAVRRGFALALNQFAVLGADFEAVV